MLLAPYRSPRNMIALFKRKERHRRSLAPVDFIGAVFAHVVFVLTLIIVSKDRA